MDPKTNITPCPSPEELQDYCDVLPSGQANHPLASHIAHCEACQKRLRAYSSLDQALSQMMTPPEGLSGRILAAVHTPELPQQKTVVPNASPWWKWIAWGGIAAAACLAITSVLWTKPNLQTTRPQVATYTREPSPDSAASLASQPASSFPQMQSQEALASSEPSSSAPQNTLVLDRQAEKRDFGVEPQVSPTQQVTQVGTQGESSGDRRVSVMDVPQTLPGRVHHVWVVPNLGRAYEELGRLIGQKVEASPDGLAISISDQKLQSLVDSLHSRHWALLSPSFPQPGQAESLHLTGHPVEYILDIHPQEE